MRTKHLFAALLCASVVIGLMGCRHNTGNEPTPNPEPTPTPTPEPTPTNYAEKIIGAWQEIHEEGYETSSNIRYYWNRDWNTNTFISYQIDLNTNTQSSYNIANDDSHCNRDEYVFDKDGSYVCNYYTGGRLNGTTHGTYRIVGSTIFLHFIDIDREVTDDETIVRLTDDKLVLESLWDGGYEKVSFNRINTQTSKATITGKWELYCMEGRSEQNGMYYGSYYNIDTEISYHYESLDSGIDTTYYSETERWYYEFTDEGQYDEQFKTTKYDTIHHHYGKYALIDDELIFDYDSIVNYSFQIVRLTNNSMEWRDFNIDDAQFINSTTMYLRKINE